MFVLVDALFNLMLYLTYLSACSTVLIIIALFYFDGSDKNNDFICRHTVLMIF